MAKVRVYELAKELNMESKKLVEELVAGGMNIKNYMSTLDEQAVSKAKELVYGKISEIVEEKRIKPTVIRRRKKVTVEQKVPSEKVVEKTAEDKEEPQKPEPPQDESTAQEEAVARVKTPEEEPREAEIEQKAVELPAAEDLPAPEIIPEAEPPTDKVETEPPPAEDAVKLAEVVKARPKRPKKKKVDQPARIIKPADERLVKRPFKSQVEEKAVEPPTQRPVSPAPSEIKRESAETPGRSKPSGRKKEKKKVEGEEPGLRSIFHHRKKEVYERVDLYEDRGFKGKTRRGDKKSKETVKKRKRTEITVPKAIKRRIKVQEFVTAAELAKAIGTKAAELIRRLMSLGFVTSINERIDFETASVVADDFGYELELDTFDEVRLIEETADRPEDMESRPPVVTIMGHVDHGKTSLLDYIRESNITGRESGGITQHIGAYYVGTGGGDIVFLDTPGHEAFTAMRARGAEVTDLIVLVVAADDGVMPQTREAINHARAANVPIVLAINKIDKQNADPDKVKRELAELDLTPEDWGGDTISGHISAKTGEGIDELLNLILLQSEMLELKGNPNKSARGAVIEAKLDKAKGSVATVLIGNGTLHQGDQFVCGEHYGRVRAMLNHRGKKVNAAGPSVPVEIYGISGVPMAGDEFIVVQDEKTAKNLVEHRKNRRRQQDVAHRGIVSLDDLFEKIKEGEVKELNIVLKTDVQGSLEALEEALVKQSTQLVKLNIIHSATGGITESDVMLSAASNAIIIGFNVRANPRVIEIAEREKVDIRYYDVIYDVIKDIRLAMTGLLDPVFKEHVIGRADVKEIFRVPKVGAVAGCHVSNGHVERNANVRLLRDDKVIFDGKIASLRRFKEDVKEVQSGYECGIGLENFADIKPGDVFEVYQMEEVKAEL
ncbi:MAG: translation initiation factor IF-2 [Thermodesulfobacteriota bacterium]|nr:translation initiation factor IF-2 [Thermodesulfobacteriota bacterium]